MQKVICFVLAALCATSLGCGHGFTRLERGLDQMEGRLTYQQAVDRWGMPYKLSSHNEFLVVTWYMEPMVYAGQACDYGDNCLLCQVVWDEYRFYFKSPEMRLDHWSSGLFGGKTQTRNSLIVPDGKTAEKCLKDSDCRRWAEDMCRVRTGPLPAVMPPGL